MREVTLRKDAPPCHRSTSRLTSPLPTSSVFAFVPHLFKSSQFNNHHDVHRALLQSAGKYPFTEDLWALLSLSSLLESNDTTRPSPHLQWERDRIKCSNASHPMRSESPFFVSFTVSLTFIQGDCMNAHFYVLVLPSFLELTLLFPCFFLSCFSGPRASPTVPVALVV